MRKGEIMSKLLIKGAKVIDPGQKIEGALLDVLIENGKIAALKRDLPTGDAEVVDGRGCVAAPGLVDMHVHLRDPGFTEKEDILTGCEAAAAGGVTSLLCMPNTRPAIDSPETVRYVLEKSADAKARVYVAAAITRGLNGEALCGMEQLAEAGASAFSDDGRPVADSRLMAEAMQRAAALGRPVVSHCEDLFLSAGGLMNEGAVSRKLGVPGVPAAAENCATAREIALAESYGVPIHICHVSTAVSAAMIRDAQRRGVRVTGETAPHYFALTEEALLDRDADKRMSPPLRTEEDRLAICEALRDGTLAVIATDHAPHTPQEKVDFEKAPNGSIGMETSLAAGITELVGPGILTLYQLLERMSTTPAHLLGLPAGSLEPGAPADLVLFNHRESWTVDPKALHGKSENAVFKGRTLLGRVRLTVCRGAVVYRAL